MDVHPIIVSKWMQSTIHAYSNGRPFCHVKNTNSAIKVFKLILNEFYTYLIGWNKKIYNNYSLFSAYFSYLCWSITSWWQFTWIRRGSENAHYWKQSGWKKPRYFQIFALRLMNFDLLEPRKIQTSFVLFSYDKSASRY